MSEAEKTVVKVEDLSVEYHSGNSVVKAVNGISFELRKGRTLGLVGETGAGKTTTALALMRLLPDRVSFVTGGHISVLQSDVMRMSKTQMKMLHGEIISMIFQDPMTALNPIMTVGAQIEEALKNHNPQGSGREDISRRVDTLLEMVGIPAERKKEYPVQFSGGMKQRVMIAMALACEPEILIADEPTTALDVTIQAQVLALIDDLKRRMGMSMIMITHDLGIVVKTCDDVAVMYAGEIVEYGTVEQIFTPGMHHPYTDGLFAAIPSIRSRMKRLRPIDGAMPDPTRLPRGCFFAPRCPFATERCREEHPAYQTEHGHRILCHRAGGGKQE